MSDAFSDDELKVIQETKDVLRVLAQIIRDRDVREVVKDPELAKKLDEMKLEKPLPDENDPQFKKKVADMKLEQALLDKNLGPEINKKTTPDLPLLNAEQEALIICQLGATVFGRLFKPKKEDGDDT